MKANFRCTLILWIVLTGIGKSCFAQPEIVWDTAFGSSSIYNFGTSKPTSDGGIVYSCSKIHGANLYSPWIVKFDAYGKWEWDKRYGVEEDGEVKDIIQTHEGGYLLTGKIRVPDAGYDLWLLKLDEKGDSVWSKTFGGPLYESGTSIVWVSDESYFISGQADELSGQQHTGLWLLKIDNKGDTLWTRKYGAGDKYSLSLENLVKSGSHDYAGIEVIDIDGESALESGIVLFNDDGDTLWTKCLTNPPYSCFATSISPASDGGFILTGMQYTGESWDLLLLKVNPEGETEWSVTFGADGWEMGHSVQQTAEGGYIIGGTTDSYGLYANNLDAWLIKTDSHGHKVWSNTYGGEAENERFIDVHALADGGYYATGNYNSLFWVARFNPDTTIHFSTREVDPFISACSLHNYPNPFSRETCIEYSVPMNSRVSISVFDIMGKEIKCLTDNRISEGGHYVLWDGSDSNGMQVPKGIYYCRMMVKEEQQGKSFTRTNRMIRR
jgi:hypothetical protein